MPPLCSIIAEISGLPCVDQNDFFGKRVKEYGKKKKQEFTKQKQNEAMFDPTSHHKGRCPFKYCLNNSRETAACGEPYLS